MSKLLVIQTAILKIQIHIQIFAFLNSHIKIQHQ